MGRAHGPSRANPYLGYGVRPCMAMGTCVTQVEERNVGFGTNRTTPQPSAGCGVTLAPRFVLNLHLTGRLVHENTTFNLFRGQDPPRFNR